MKKKTIYEFSEQQLHAMISKHITENDTSVDFNSISVQFINGSVPVHEEFTKIEVTVIKKEVKSHSRAAGVTA